MKKISFRLRSFDKEQFLTFDIDNEAELDEELLDYLEDEEPEGIVPVIFEEQEEFDTFSYDITDKIHLCELSNQEINAEMVLMVLRGLVLSLMNMSEYRIPLSYLVLNRQYIYIDSDYKVEFVCIPLEDMKEEADLTNFFRNFIASLRFDSSENGDYVAKLLTYVNNRELFNLHNLLELVEEQMERFGIEIPEGDSNEIYGEYTEIDESEGDSSYDNNEEVDKEILNNIINEGNSDEMEEYDADSSVESIYEEPIEEAAEPVYEEPVEEAAEPVYEEPVEEASEPEDEEAVEEPVAETANEEEAENIDDEIDEQDGQSSTLRSIFKTKENVGAVGVVIEDDFDAFLAEKEKEDQDMLQDDPNIKIRKDIKINRASIVKNTQDELKSQDDASEEDRDQQEQEKSEDKKDESNDASSQAQSAGSIPKVNPYLIRVNTDERIMIKKQTFKIGKAGMGVDYTIDGNGAISRVHAIITGKDGEYFIKDNKSTNHTFVDGKNVEEGENVPLTDGCKIVLGDEEFVFKL